MNRDVYQMEEHHHIRIEKACTNEDNLKSHTLLQGRYSSTTCQATISVLVSNLGFNSHIWMKEKMRIYSIGLFKLLMHSRLFLYCFLMSLGGPQKNLTSQFLQESHKSERKMNSENNSYFITEQWKTSNSLTRTLLTRNQSNLRASISYKTWKCWRQGWGQFHTSPGPLFIYLYHFKMLTSNHDTSTRKTKESLPWLTLLNKPKTSKISAA